MTRFSLRTLALLGVAILLINAALPGVSSRTVAAPMSQGASRTFPETGKTVRGTFLDYWNAHGGLAQQGFPISDEMQERSDIDGKTYTVQYFERAVFEYHPENQPPFNVLLSLLGDLQLKQKYANGTPIQHPNTRAGSVLFTQTGHRLGGTFLDYWNAHGGLMQQGYPISDELSETSNLDGKQYTVQYFERAVFEYHPENQAPNNVLLSQLGTFRYKAKYAGGGSIPAGSKPNIVFILTDDMRADDVQYMPKLKALIADQGMTFSNFFVTDSLCCPSRSSIQRGEYVHNHQVLGNSAPTGGWQKFYALGNQNSTIGTWLQSGGYKTALMGKYLNGYPDSVAENYVPPGWDEWDSPSKGGYEEFDYTLNENGTLKQYGHNPQDYLVDVMSNKAVAFIDQNVQAKQPFFMYLATFAPHQPATPAPRYADAFPGIKAPRPPDFNQADVSTKPQFIKNLPLLTDKQIQAIDDLYRLRAQSLQAVDDMIANVVDKLKATGQLDNTYIFFTSDNGFHLGNKRMELGKQTAYETDIKVPLMVRGSGIAAGKTNDQLTMEVDFAPTFAQLAGVQPPDFVDGRSLLTLLKGDPTVHLPNWRTGALIEHYAGSDEPFMSQFELQQTKAGGKAAIPTYQAVRTQYYTYVEYTTGEKELYDLRTDPYELTNIYSKADPNLLKQLASMLDGLRKCSGATCRAADSVALNP